MGGFMPDDPSKIVQTKRLIGALLQMRPKPHSEMKLGKSRTKPVKSLKKRPGGASATAKTS
jgi:hypothetical protein